MPRSDKVAQAIKKEIGGIIHDELKDPRLGFVTVTRVELTRDLRYAKVFFSVLGKEEEHKKTKDALDSALGFIRRLIAQRIRLRFVPEIVFKEDNSVEYDIKIQKLLEEVKNGNKRGN
ncbi:MAG: 30S ribosome-binding factor RbfA [Candidatus Omnitrophota bacterium]|nr:MAG: 30S ribosome-binding factor RbfA [Candidatus Omnitrophota bacterium]